MAVCFNRNAWVHCEAWQWVAQQPVYPPEAIECVAGMQPAVIIQDDTLARLQGHGEAVAVDGGRQLRNPFRNVRGEGHQIIQAEPYRDPGRPGSGTWVKTEPR